MKKSTQNAHFNFHPTGKFLFVGATAFCPWWGIGALLCVWLCATNSVSGEVASSPVAQRQTEVSQVSEASSLQKILAAQASGEISKQEQALLQLRYLRYPESLPQRFLTTVPATPIKCGFEFAHTAKSMSASLSSTDAATASSLAGRPTTQQSILSPAGHFRVHFDISGAQAVPVGDTNGNSVPDFIDRAAAFFDTSWTYFHSSMGYLTPPTDSGGGGDNLYDVYFQSIAGYGVTFFDVTGPAPWQDYASFIVLHNTFTGFAPNNDPEGSQMGALKVTCAHEYFHAVQLAYDGNDELWLYESSATRMENEIFPLSDDNYQYLPSFFSQPQTYLTSTQGYHVYGAFVWPEFLAASHGEIVLRELWEYARNYNGLVACDSAIAQHGATLRLDFQNFVYWNFFTGPRAQVGYYASAADYPGAVYDQILPAPPFTAVGPFLAPDGVACNYLIMPTLGAPQGLLKLSFDGSPLVRWGVNMIYKTGAVYTVSQFVVPTPGEMVVTRFDYGGSDTIFVVPTVVTPFVDNNSYTLTAEILPFGDADGSGSVDIGDGIFLIAYIFSGGPPPPYDLRLGDADCSADISISDVIYLISYIFLSGPVPCDP